MDNKRGVMLLFNEAFSSLTKYQDYSPVKGYNHITSFTSRLFFFFFWGELIKNGPPIIQCYVIVLYAYNI